MPTNRTEVGRFAYFPALRWKQGEQMAVRKLDGGDRERILPIAEVQSIAAKPLGKLSTQLGQAHASEFPIALDLSPAYPNGYVNLPYLAGLTSRLQRQGLKIWPVIRGADALLNPSALPQFKFMGSVVLRVNPHEMTLVDAMSVLAELQKACGKHTSIYVLIDLYSITDIDLSSLAAVPEPFVRAMTSNGTVAQVSVLAGSFPYQLGGFAQGIKARIPRKELTVWKSLRSRPGCADVAFGDYAVTNPLPLEEIDPRKLNPAAAIRYTLKNEWWLLRAAGVRTKNKGGMGQYNALCKLLVVHPDFSGAKFSYGDNQYIVHAQPGASSGSFMTWRRDATSHHLVYTVRQLISGKV